MTDRTDEGARKAIDKTPLNVVCNQEYAHAVPQHACMHVCWPRRGVGFRVRGRCGGGGVWKSGSKGKISAALFGLYVQDTACMMVSGGGCG